MQPQTSCLNGTTTTDVVAFFEGLVCSYLSFEKSVMHVTGKITRLTPTQIDIECQKLKLQRAHLHQMDLELFQLLELAGQELKNHELLDEYRVAFSRAAMACDLLRDELAILRISISQTELL